MRSKIFARGFVEILTASWGKGPG